MNRLGQFSLGWWVGIIFLHAAVTLALALLLFVGGMGSFTYGPGAGFHVTKAVMWIWSPFAMAAGSGNSGIGIALLWSLIVGVLAGFILPLFIKPKTQKPLPPGANPDLVGTPWEQKTVVRFDTLREAEDKQNTKKPNRVPGSS
jgi:hypothetical protein